MKAKLGRKTKVCLSKDSGKPDAPEYLETMEIPAEPPTGDPHTDGELHGNVCKTGA